MQGSQFPQEDDVQLNVDSKSQTQDGSVQQSDSNPGRMANLLAKVPNLVLLAAGFFAASPLLPPNAMGGKGH